MKRFKNRRPDSPKAWAKKAKPKRVFVVPVVMRAVVVHEMTAEQWEHCYPPTDATMKARVQRSADVASMRESLNVGTNITYHNHVIGEVCGVCGYYTKYPALMRKSDKV